MNNHIIQNIKSIFEQHYQKSALENWPNKDYELLSSNIHKTTKVLISTSTLKRIFGKINTDNNYHPQKATLDALVSYSNTIKPDTSVSSKKYKNLSFIVTGIVVFLLLFVIFQNTSSIKKNTPISKIRLELQSIEGKNTATAFFQIKDTVNDSLQIYFGDYSDTISLPAYKKTTAHFYKFPGVFQPDLLKNSKKINPPIQVMVKTNGWYAMGTHEDLRKNSNVFPIPNTLLQKPEGYLHPTHKELTKCGIDISKIALLRFYNYQDFSISANDFTLSLKLKNTVFWPSVQCNNVILKIRGSQGIIKQYFSKPGCSFWMENIYSDVIKNGNTEDLSQFCIDLSSWKNITIKNQNQHLSFFQNEELIDTISYKNSLGNILGIEIHFFGTGYLDDFYLSANDGSKTYSDNFNLEL